MLTNDPENPFSGRRFAFWAITPLALATGAILPFLIDEWNPVRIGLIVYLELALVLVILTFYNPRRFHLAARSLTALVFLSFVIYLVTELVASPRSLFSSGPRSDDSARNAFLGLITVGLPCLWFTVFGRFRLRRDPPAMRTPSDAR